MVEGKHVKRVLFRVNSVRCYMPHGSVIGFRSYTLEIRVDLSVVLGGEQAESMSKFTYSILGKHLPQTNVFPGVLK